MNQSRSSLLLDRLAIRVLAHSSPREPLQFDSGLVLIRSTSFGDFVTLLPFLAETTKRVGKERVSLLLMSRHGRVGEAVLGADSGIPMVTLDASRAAGFPRELVLAGRQARGLEASRALFCGPPVDSPVPRLRRWLLARALIGFQLPMWGFEHRPPVLRPLEASLAGSQAVVNQALLPFVQFGLEPTIDRAAVLALVGITVAERARAAELVPPGLRMIGLCVGSRLARKRWPRDRYAALTNRLLEDPSVGIIFLGAEEDLPAILEVAGGVRERGRIGIGAGVLSLRETIAIASHLSVCVGNDGACCHLCALGGSPVVSIFCNWEPAGVWEPIIAPASRSLRPTQGAGRAPMDFGVETVTLDAVERATCELLGGASGHEILEIGRERSESRRRVAALPL